MNKQRRKDIEAVIEKLQEVKSHIDETIRLDIQSIYEEESEAFENLPESLQDAERGQQMSEYVDTLDEADSDCSEIIDSIDTLIEKLEEIVNS